MEATSLGSVRQGGFVYEWGRSKVSFGNGQKVAHRYLTDGSGSRGRLEDLPKYPFPMTLCDDLNGIIVLGWFAEGDAGASYERPTICPERFESLAATGQPFLKSGRGDGTRLFLGEARWAGPIATAPVPDI